METVLNTHRLTTDRREFEDLWRYQILYDISGKFAPIAIRDQFIRAYLTVERAIEEGLISEHRPLLIVGGGFSGVTAAYHAAKAGIPTYIIEKDVLLNRFARTKRYVCPTLYDFPFSHWTKEKFPLEDKSRIRLCIESGDVALLKQNFHECQTYLEGRHSPCNILSNSEISTIKIKNKRKSSVKNPKGFAVAKIKVNSKLNLDSNVEKFEEQEFGMVFSCIGFAKEQTYLKDDKDGYNGQPFWNIKFEDYNEGNLKTLICGSGDGALQDFLLILTEESSAREIYNKLELGENIKYWIERNLSEVEQYSHRSGLWRNRKNRDEDGFKMEKRREHSDLSILHDKVLAVVEKLLGLNTLEEKPIIIKPPISETVLLPSEIEISTKEVADLKRSINELIKDFYNDNEVKVAFTCNHFSSCYMLNRFLATLFIEYIQEFKGKRVLIPNQLVTKVKGLNHNCEDHPRTECYRQKHKVKSLTSICEIDEAETKKEKEKDEDGKYNLGEYDRVIIRFGLENRDSHPFNKILSPYNKCKIYFGGLNLYLFHFQKYSFNFQSLLFLYTENSEDT